LTRARSCGNASPDDSLDPDTLKDLASLPELAPTEVANALAVGGRFIWGAADQAIFSITSFALSVGIARGATPDQFGVFGITYILYILVLGAVQAFTAEAFVVRASHLSAPEQRRILSQATGCAVCFGLCLSVLGLLVGVFGHGAVSEIVPPIFVLAPLLFVQDVWRFGFFAAGRPRAALANDLLWAALIAIGFVFLASSNHSDWRLLAWVWAAGGAVCGIVGSIQSHCLPSLKAAGIWIHEHGAAGGRFAGEYLALSGAGQGVTLWVGLFAGLAASAGYRGGQLLFGPVQVLSNAIPLVVTPLLVRIARQGSRAAVWRAGLWVGALGGTLGLAWGIGLSVMPSALGRAVLGQSWSAAQPVVAPMCLFVCVTGIGLGALVQLRAFQAIKRSFKVRLVGASLILCLGAAGAVEGSVAAAYAVFVGVALTSGALWWQARIVVLQDDAPSDHDANPPRRSPLNVLARRRKEART
jgi:O-antigen/teichoic acid export membrane protein